MQYRNIRLGPSADSNDRNARGADIVLNEQEVRVLACLVEKEAATPDYYPLTLNAAEAACNQKSNRDPIVCYDEQTVRDTLASLQEKNLIRRILNSKGGRVARYRHMFPQTFALTPEHAAVLCVLMLRGPQTAGEIRRRAERIFPFRSLADVEDALVSLTERSTRPLTAKLPRRPGNKEARYTHLLSGAAAAPSSDPAPPVSLMERVETLEQEVAAMQKTLAQLRSERGSASDL